MKLKNLLLLLFMVGTLSRSLAQQGAATHADTVKRNLALVKQVRKEKAYLVDVRTPEEYGSGHLKYSQNINFKSDDFKKQVSKLDKNKTVYLYCRTGNRSGKAADTLRALGFKTAYNIGGFEALKSTGLQTAE
jgi:phage shock protein E